MSDSVSFKIATSLSDLLSSDNLVPPDEDKTQNRQKKDEDFELSEDALKNAIDAVDKWNANKAEWRCEWADPSSQDWNKLVDEALEVLVALQVDANRRDGYTVIHRGFHAKGTFATRDAELRIAKNLPEEIAKKIPLNRGGSYPAIVRFSNVSSRLHADGEKDQRGVAIRIEENDRYQDFIMTNGETHHARDAQAFVASMRATHKLFRHHWSGHVRAIWVLFRQLGLFDSFEMLSALHRMRKRGKSLAAYTFFSRAPYRLADSIVRYRLTPISGVNCNLQGTGGRDALVRDMVARQFESDIRFRLQLQGFINERETPMDDHRKRWDSPWFDIAELVIKQASNMSEAVAHSVLHQISNSIAFSPFNQWQEDFLQPLGELNHLRKAIYCKSACVSGRGAAVGNHCEHVDEEAETPA